MKCVKPARNSSLAAIAVTLLVTACNANSNSMLSPLAQHGTARAPSTSQSPIQHVVIMIQENRTFNDLFATFPGADGTTTGTVAVSKPCHIKKAHQTALKQSPLAIAHDLNHRFQGYWDGYDNGKMDGFDTIPFSDGTAECKYPYQYTNPADIQPYFQLAQQYALAEHMYPTQGSSSFVAHQDLIRGSSQISSTEAMVNDPSSSPWGCDAPGGTTTSLIDQNNVYQGGAGPLPCTNKFPPSYDYNSLRDLLDAHSVSWKYYVLPLKQNFGGLMTAYDVIWAVRHGPEWKTNIATPQTKIFTDITNGALPQVSWVIPDEPDSDHPGEKIDNGPSWVSSVVNAIGQSSYWSSTAIIVVWDDWGGLYDNLPPARHGFGGLGFRVPAIIISPYSKPGYISQTNYEFGSILRYIEDNWNLGTLGTTDQTSTSIIDCFNYSQKPSHFRTIKAKYSKEYFLRRKPSGLPIDTDM